MSFISYEFLILFAAVVAVYFRCGHRLQNRLLLAASYVFYGWWDVRFLALIVASTLTDFVVAQIADPERNPPARASHRKLAVMVSVVVNLGLLGVFKYYDFFVGSLSALGAQIGFDLSLPVLNVVLPVGISFYTFQTLSYTLDVYRGEIPASRSIVDFALYVSFFPQLVAGPIERGKSLLPQVVAPRPFSAERIYSGTQLMLVGFFKKMVIADNLATVTNQVYNASDPSAGAVVVGTYAFAFQIYCDFSGYTDIARGAARILGFDLRRNFDLPYLAINPSDFWKRWHISLSSWLRDYLYIPLGGSRHGPSRTVVALSATMLLGGLWHGAEWTFVLWGAYHGLLLAVFRPFRSRAPSRKLGLTHALRVAAFFQLTCFGWLLFRAESIDALGGMLSSAVANPSFDGVNAPMLIELLVGAVPLMLFQIYQYRRGVKEVWADWPVAVRVVFYVALVYGIVLLGSPVANDFIYFQF